MTTGKKPKPTGYDKLVNYKNLGIAAGAFALVLVLPMPASMLDVAVEQSAGPGRVLDFFAQDLWGRPFVEVEQWQAMTARVLEASVRQGALTRRVAEGRDARSIKALGVDAAPEHVERYQAFVGSMTDEAFLDLMTRAHRLRNEELAYGDLREGERARADRAAFHLKVCVALVAFVVLCFLTEAIPLPGVAFCVGIILVVTGYYSYRDIAAFFWSDACWFIMGSLMFAAAFVKTGVDRRVCLMMFKALAKPQVGVITGILILVIAPAASFISDHALAAMFLPVVMILYANTAKGQGKDVELAKMLVITVAMACNIGGFGAPSGGARNVIVMTYLEDMFGISMGYAQWVLYGMPFVLVMMPILWVLLNWRFKPTIRDLGPALQTLKEDIARGGGWNRKQVVAIVIFVVMFLGWVTEKDVLSELIGVRLGIGVIAVMGAVAYLLTGIVSWRDYQEKVDWGVVWLYAGAIVFGRALDQSGAAFWMARSVVEGLASMGVESAQVLIAVGGAVTAVMTNLMADGPAAAAVAPITLNMAAVHAPGTTLVPFMGLTTACASSMAYLLIIGTPPNAIVYASGVLEPKDYLRVGIPAFVAAFVVIMAMNFLYWPLLGFPGLRPM